MKLSGENGKANICGERIYNKETGKRLFTEWIGHQAATDWRKCYTKDNQ